MTSHNKGIPQHCHHKHTGQGYVRLNGKAFYTGRWGLPEGRAKYDRLIQEFLMNGRTVPEQAGDDAYLIEDLVTSFWAHYSAMYPGRLQKDPMKQALAVILDGYGTEEAEAFGPLQLLCVRETMVKRGMTRKLINARVTMIKRLFRWGVERELIPVEVSQRVASLDGLRQGQTEAKEGTKVKPVERDDVEAVLPYVSRQVEAMIRLQTLTGMRPGEVLIMRGKDIDRTKPVWLYVPPEHKNKHRDIPRTIGLGPKCQAILNPFLLRAADLPLFSPREALLEHRALRRSERKSKETPSHKKRKRQTARNPKRNVRDSYAVSSYRQNIARACETAGVPQWFPNQLRHTFATEIRELFGLDVAQVLLGHTHAKTTEIYAQVNVKKLEEIMKQIG